MSTLISNLNTIESVKVDIKSAIADKGVDMTGLSFTDYPAAIASISGGGGGFAGYTEKSMTEGVILNNLSNSASFVASSVFQNNSTLQTVYLPECSIVYLSAFLGCPNLTSVNFLSDTLVMEAGALSSCTNLTTANIPGCTELPVGLFYSCNNLTEVTLTTESMVIGNMVFYQCSALQSVSVPGCTAIGTSAFNGCSSLQSIYTPDCSVIGVDAFRNCSSLSQAYMPLLSVVPNYAFQGTAIESIDLPNCTELGVGAFDGCVSLTSISLPSCEVVGQAALEGTGLTSISLPVCTNIGSIAFAVWGDVPTGISYIYAPLAENIGPGAFRNTALTSYVLPSTLSYINGSVFTNTAITSASFPMVRLVSDMAFGWCSSLSTVSLPECLSVNYAAFQFAGLTELNLPKLSCVNGQMVFTYCTSLSSVSLPRFMNKDSVFAGRTNNIFAGCSSLTEVELPLCFNLGYGAFASCTSLSRVSIPLYCQGGQTFINCLNLSELTIGTETPWVPAYQNDLAQTPFATGGSGVIYVDAAMYESWTTAAGWSQFSSYMVSVGNTDPMVSMDTETGVITGKTGYFGGYIWTTMSSATTVSLPNCKVVGARGFLGFTELSEVSLPNCIAIHDYAFVNCSSLTELNLPVCEYLGSSLFSGAGITSVTLGYSGVVNIPLSANMIFTSQLVFVPSEWVDTYKADSYWSAYSSQIFAIPE